MLRLPRLLTGRHLFYCRAKPTLAAVQVTLNLLARGRLIEAARVLRRGPGLRAKRLVFDNGIHEDEGCRPYCPNPVLRDGRFVPVCVADRVGIA